MAAVLASVLVTDLRALLPLEFSSEHCTSSVCAAADIAVSLFRLGVLPVPVAAALAGPLYAPLRRVQPGHSRCKRSITTVCAWR